MIGRMRVDNYLLSVPYERPKSAEDFKYVREHAGEKWNMKGHLIDTSHYGMIVRDV